MYAITVNNEKRLILFFAALDKELENIGSSADVIIVAADKHLEDTLKAGESVSLSVKLYRDVQSVSPSEVPSKSPSEVPSKPLSKVPSN